MSAPKFLIRVAPNLEISLSSLTETGFFLTISTKTFLGKIRNSSTSNSSAFLSTHHLSLSISGLSFLSTDFDFNLDDFRPSDSTVFLFFISRYFSTSKPFFATSRQAVFTKSISLIIFMISFTKVLTALLSVS